LATIQTQGSKPYYIIGQIIIKVYIFLWKNI